MNEATRSEKLHHYDAEGNPLSGNPNSAIGGTGYQAGPNDVVGGQAYEPAGVNAAR
jgi:hypothetical protein